MGERVGDDEGCERERERERDVMMVMTRERESLTHCERERV